MSNPWDRPPLPTHGDSDEDVTYAGVGRVVTQWEQVELALSRLYSLFVDRYNDRNAMREYGEGGVLHARLGLLVVAHERFSSMMPDQELEQQFGLLIETIRLYAARRNDIAHGLVWPIQWQSLQSGIPIRDDQLSPLQFCVVPPDYKRNLFDPQNLPLYVYTRPELNDLQITFFKLSNSIMNFTYKLHEAFESRRSFP